MRAEDGAGVRLVRVLGHEDVYDFDPFLMLDSFDSTDPRDYVAGFPTHPHRGIVCVLPTVRPLIPGDHAILWVTAVRLTLTLYPHEAI